MDNFKSGLHAGQSLGLEHWPTDQEGEFLSSDPTIICTRFHDIEKYHANLVKAVLDREGDSELCHKTITGSSKVRGLHLWDVPEASFINDRALAMFRATTKREQIQIREAWASVYRAGDYLSPHGHPNVEGTITYCLDHGNPDISSNVFAGQLMFADPRLKYCCPKEDNCVTFMLTPEFQDGSMLLFPGYLQHFVNLYNGTRPRITLSWDLI